MDVRLTDVLVADAKLLADGLLQPEDDMAVFVGRGGKGRIAPFTVRRSYTGAGGWYVESMALLAPNGDVAWRGNEQPITLRGSSKIDLFSDDLHGVIVDSVDASARVFPPSDPLFNRLVPILLPRRLNLRDGEEATDRWRKECTLVELTPSAIPAEA